MIYSSDMKQIVNDDNIFKLIKEAELMSLYNYHSIIAELCMSELNESSLNSLNESFSIGGIVRAIGDKISEVFAKIKEIVKTITMAKDSLFQFSDQLYKSTNFEFFKKLEKYDNKFKFKATLIDSNAIGDNGSDINDKIIKGAKSYLDKVKEDIKNSKVENNDTTTVEQDLTDLVSKTLNVQSINIKDIKKTILNNLTLPEQEFVGLDEDILEATINTMKLSPIIIKNSWDRACEKQMKELKSQAIELGKSYKDDGNPETIKAINRCKAYIIGCTTIVSQVHMAYLEATVKGIRAYRKIYMTVLNTIKMPKEKGDNK